MPTTFEIHGRIPTLARRSLHQRGAATAKARGQKNDELIRFPVVVGFPVMHGAENVITNLENRGCSMTAEAEEIISSCRGLEQKNSGERAELTAGKVSWFTKPKGTHISWKQLAPGDIKGIRNVCTCPIPTIVYSCLDLHRFALPRDTVLYFLMHPIDLPRKRNPRILTARLSSPRTTTLETVEVTRDFAISADSWIIAEQSVTILGKGCAQAVHSHNCA